MPIDTKIKGGAFVVETRALIDEIAPAVEKIKELGGECTGSAEIVDEFYADMSEISPKHTFERSCRASRIRTVKNGSEYIVTTIKEAPENRKDEEGLHDAAVVTFCEKGDVKDLDKAKETLRQKGFPDFVTRISKKRMTYVLGEHIVCVDDIEGFGPGIEIQTTISSEDEIPKTKKMQKELLQKLGVAPSDIVKKSLTHMIIDARIKSDPKVKIPFLKSEVAHLEKQRTEKMLESNKWYTEGGDGWHDNAGWTILMDEIEMLDIRIKNLKQELSDALKK